MGLKLPPGKRCAAAFTFDVDGMSIWLGMMRMATKGPLSRGEFGVRVGMPRILEMLDQYGVKATFFVPGHTARTHPQVFAEAAKRGHEVAAHSMYHSPMEVHDRTPLEEKRRYLREQMEILERATGKKPLGFRATGEFASDDVPKLLLEMGFLYDSSLMGDDFFPYRLRLGDKIEREEPYRVEFGSPSPLIEFPWQWDLDDFPHFEFISYFLNPRNPWYAAAALPSYKKVVEVFLANFDCLYKKFPGGLFHAVLHPQCCARGQRLLFLEEILRYVTGYGDTWVAPLVELARAWRD